MSLLNIIKHELCDSRNPLVPAKERITIDEFLSACIRHHKLKGWADCKWIDITFSTEDSDTVDTLKTKIMAGKIKAEQKAEQIATFFGSPPSVHKRTQKPFDCDKWDVCVGEVEVGDISKPWGGKFHLVLWGVSNSYHDSMGDALHEAEKPTMTERLVDTFLMCGKISIKETHMKSTLTGQVFTSHDTWEKQLYLSNGVKIPLLEVVEGGGGRGQRLTGDQAIQYTILMYEATQERIAKEKKEQEEKDKFRPTGTECFTMVYPCNFSSGHMLELVLKNKSENKVA